MTERNTIQKEIILNAVKELANHPTAEDVYEHIHHSYPNISKATVYRNLKLLAELDRLKRIECVNLADHYDHQCHDHYHIQCSECNCVYDANLDYMYDLDSRVIAPEGFQVEGHDIVFKGICPECNNSPA